MKNFLVFSLFCLNLSFANGLPTIDITAISNSIKEYANEAERWKNTIQHYKNQIKAYSDALASQTGMRDSVSFLRETKKIYDTFGSDYKSMSEFFKDVNGDPINLLNEDERKNAESIFDELTIFDICKDIKDEIEKNICRQKMLSYSSELAQMQDYNTQLDNLSKELSNLQDKAANSKDIKDSGDIGNAINISLAQSEMINLRQNYKLAMQRNQRNIKDEQKYQLELKRASTRSTYSKSEFDKYYKQAQSTLEGK